MDRLADLQECGECCHWISIKFVGNGRCRLWEAGDVELYRARYLGLHLQHIVLAKD